jgi:hypothetical protein
MTKQYLQQLVLSSTSTAAPSSPSAADPSASKGVQGTAGGAGSASSAFAQDSSRYSYNGELFNQCDLRTRHCMQAVDLSCSQIFISKNDFNFILINHIQRVCSQSPLSDSVGSVSYARKFHQFLVVGLIEACKGIVELFPDVLGSEGRNEYSFLSSSPHVGGAGVTAGTGASVGAGAVQSASEAHTQLQVRTGNDWEGGMEGGIEGGYRICPSMMVGTV